MRRLLHQVEDLLAEGAVRNGPRGALVGHFDGMED